MAFRADISVDWIASPRIITVAQPSIELNIQDLHDTLVTLEASLDNLDSKQVVSSAGKETLDATTKVGITMTLLNAKVGFQARTTWTQCAIKGGNLVAVDEFGVTMSPINPTAFVNIDRTSSSSGTLQEQDALQYASYGGGVTINVTTATSGTEFPSGTQEFPVNNIPDAVQIAFERGFHTLFLVGNLTLDTGDNVEGYRLVGQNPVRSYLTILDGAATLNCEILECTVIGVLDGNATLRDCVIGPLQYVNGAIYHCGLTESIIQLGGTAQAIFIDTYSTVPGFATPTVDMGGSGQAFALRGHTGGLKIQNRTGTDACSLDMNSGHLIFDSTCTAGDVYARGVFQLTDNSGVGCTIHTDAKVITGDRHNANIVSVTGTDVIDIDDFKADSISIDYAAISASVWGYLNRTLTGESDVDADGIADAVWTKYLNDGGIRFTNDHATLITMAKEMLYNKAIVSSDKRIVRIYADNGVDIKYTIDVSADELERTPRV